MFMRKAGQEDREWIDNLYLKVVPRFYEDAESYSQLWWRSYLDNDNELGFFSLEKEVFVFEDGQSSLGFAVLTYKRGGSAKLSPLILEGRLPDVGAAWRLLESYARDRGIRKLYCDIPSARWHLFSLLHDLGVRIEAHLARQYSPDYDSIVCGKSLVVRDGPAYVTMRKCRLATEEPGDSAQWVPLQSVYRDGVLGLIEEHLSSLYDGLDETFVDSLYRAVTNKAGGFEVKGKDAYVAVGHNNPRNVVGLAVLTPKRGGSVKLGPFFLVRDVLGPESARNVVSRVLHLGQAAFPYARKVYSILPILESTLVRSLYECGYNVEGVLREPYKPYVDCLVLSRFGGWCSEIQAY